MESGVLFLFNQRHPSALLRKECRYCRTRWTTTDNSNVVWLGIGYTT